MSASTSIPNPEYRKARGWFRRHIGDPLARLLLARVRGPGAVLEVDGTSATRRIPIMIWPRDGCCERNIILSSDDLPAPDGPVRKWNEPAARGTSRRGAPRAPGRTSALRFAA